MGYHWGISVVGYQWWITGDGIPVVRYQWWDTSGVGFRRFALVNALVDNASLVHIGDFT